MNFINTKTRSINPNFYKTKDELSNHLKKMPLKSELILIKGSRGMKMENVIKYIF
jgi:UDP-N-acetylmuramyl pentapeptide synthase